MNQTPEQRARDEINEYNPRIAVTVDMTATSTDVKPLECILLHTRHKKLSEEEISAEFFKKEKQTTLFGDDEITRKIRNSYSAYCKSVYSSVAYDMAICY